MSTTNNQFWNRQNDLRSFSLDLIDHPEKVIKTRKITNALVAHWENDELGEIINGFGELVTPGVIQGSEGRHLKEYLIKTTDDVRWWEAICTGRAFQYLDHPDATPRIEYQICFGEKRVRDQEVEPDLIITLKFILTRPRDGDEGPLYGLRAIESGRSYDGIRAAENNTLLEIPVNQILGMSTMPELPGWEKHLISNSPYRGTSALGEALRAASPNGNKVYNHIVERWNDVKKVWRADQVLDAEMSLDGLRFVDIDQLDHSFFVKLVKTDDGFAMGEYCATLDDLRNAAAVIPKTRLETAPLVVPETPAVEPAAVFAASSAMEVPPLPGAQNYHPTGEAASEVATKAALDQYDAIMEGLHGFTLALKDINSGMFFLRKLFETNPILYMQMYKAMELDMFKGEHKEWTKLPFYVDDSAIYYVLEVTGNWQGMDEENREGCFVKLHGKSSGQTIFTIEGPML